MKKLKININKKTIATAIYTLALLSVINFAIYPKTNSLFLKDKKQGVLAYTSSLNNTELLLFNMNLNEAASNIDTIVLTLDLIRDEKYVNENDEYIIEAFSNLENGDFVTCSIVSNSGKDVAITEDGKIKFNDGKNSGNIDISCDVKANIANKEDINVLARMYETVNNEEKMPYGISIKNFTYDYYFNKYSLISIDDEEIDVYKAFIQLLESHYNDLKKDQNSYAYKHNIDLAAYIRYVDYYLQVEKDAQGEVTKSNAKEVLFNSNPFALMGVIRNEVKDDSDNSLLGYSFNFREDFTGYVKTYNWYFNRGDEADAKHLYFSTNNSDLIKSEVEYVIKNYAYNNSADANKVYNYINSYINDKCQGKYSIENLSNIPGLEYVPTGEDTGDSYPFIRLETPILDIADNYMSNKKPGDTKTFKISHYDMLGYETIMEKVFSYALGEAYNEPKDAIYNRLIIDGDLDTAIICKTNCSDYEEVIYNYSDNKYYTIKIIHKDGYNEITTSKSDANPVSGSDKLNTAITCKTNCKNYSEVHYDKTTYTKYDVTQYENKMNRMIITKYSENPILGSGNFYKYVSNNARYGELQYNGENYLQVNVLPSDANNPLTITLENIGTEINPNYGGSPMLEDAIKNQTSGVYKELRYRNGKYTLISVVHNGPISIVLNGNPDANAQKAFNEFLGSEVKSINLSLENEDYLESIPSADSYNEIHYDGENYLLVRVRSYTNEATGINQKIITVSKLWSPTITEENELNIQKMIKDYNDSQTYVYHVADLDHMQNTLEKYLLEYFTLSRRPLAATEEMKDYTSGYYRLTDILP